MRPQLTTILIIDDDQDLPEITKAILESRGYHVFVYHDAESAIKDIHKTKPHLILMDVMLPGIDGAQAVKQVRRDPAYRQIPVIFLTGLVSSNDHELHDLGIQVDGLNFHVLAKPFETEDLLKLIQKMLG